MVMLRCVAVLHPQAVGFGWICCEAVGSGGYAVRLWVRVGMLWAAWFSSTTLRVRVRVRDRVRVGDRVRVRVRVRVRARVRVRVSAWFSRTKLRARCPEKVVGLGCGGRGGR
jgi:uncharacterized protein (DUF58 family)